MAITYFKAIRSIAKLTISFAFELAEQQLMLAKQLTDRLVKPPNRPSKATFVAPNVPLGTKADDVRQVLAGTTIDDTVQTRVTAPDDAAQALVRTPDDAVRPLVTTSPALVERADDAMQARVMKADDAAPALVTTTDEDPELSLRAERLVIDRQRVQHGEAQVRKEIMTEMKSIAVPVNHEELVVERHAATGDVAVDSEPIADQTIRIPLSEEKVNIAKETVVWDEVEIGKRDVEDVEHISDTVPHEELRVNDTTIDFVTPRANLEELVTTADDAAPAVVTMPGPNTSSAENEQAVFDAQVQKRAYALWQAEGRPDGQQLDHWTKAELELSAMRPNAGNNC